MIKICNLNFKYKNSSNILKNINLEIKEGETVAIIGKNGSGKSTLAKLISGIMKTKNGNIIIDDLDLAKKGEYKEAVNDYINNDLYSLSLGQKQRIAIAEILAKSPKYLVFDEPTTMIDSTGKEQIYNIIKNLKKDGYTIIYTSNLAEEILLADRILILKNGQIVNEIKKDFLMESIDILEQNDIKLPMIVEIALKLGIKLEEYSVDELVRKIK